MRKISISRILGLLSLSIIISIVGGGRKHLIYANPNPSSYLDAYQILDDYANQLYESKKMVTKYIVKSIDGNQVLLESKDVIRFEGIQYYTYKPSPDASKITEQQNAGNIRSVIKININTKGHSIKRFKIGDEIYLIPTYVADEYNNNHFYHSFRVNSKNYTIYILSHLFGENILRESDDDKSTTDFEFITVINGSIYENYAYPMGYQNLNRALESQTNISLGFNTPPFQRVHNYGRDSIIPVFDDGSGYQIKPNAVIITDYWNKPTVKITPNLRFSSSYLVIKGRSGIKLTTNSNLKLTINNIKLSSTLQELKFKPDEDVVIKLHKYVLWRGRFSNKSLIKSSSNSSSIGNIYIDSSSISNNTNLGDLITNNYIFNPTKLQKNSLQSLQFNLE